jgi:hypothetical protein
MIYFDGTYRLKPPGDVNIPIRKWKDAWRVRIIDLGFNRPGLKFLRSKIIVAVRTAGEALNTTCAESLGKRICRDFDLDETEILWVELLPGSSGRFFAADFTKRPYIVGPETNDPVAWRPVLPNEIDAIRHFIPEIEPT